MAQLLENVIQQFFDANGDPLAGGKLHSYLAGTSTPAATYTDQTEGANNTNPVILDANGQASIWIGAASYKFVLMDANDVVLWTVDNVAHINNGSITVQKLGDAAVETVKIKDLAVTTAKLADKAVTTAKLDDAAVTTVKIADGAVTFPKLPAVVPVRTSYGGDFGNNNGHLQIQQFPWTEPAQDPGPSLLPSSTGKSVAWSPNGEFLAVSTLSTGGPLAIYARSGSVFEKIITPDAVPNSEGRGVSWSPDGKLMAASFAGIPLVAYKKTGRALSYTYEPASSLVNEGWAVAFSPNSEFAAVGVSLSPRVAFYRRSVVNTSAYAVKYNALASTTVSGGATEIINFDSQDTTFTDGPGLVTTGAAWKWTATRAARIRVNAVATMVSASFTGSAQLQVWKNIGYNSILDEKSQGGAAAAARLRLQGEDCLFVAPGDVVSVRVFNNSSYTLSTDNNNGGFLCRVTITEEPGLSEHSIFSKLSDPALLPAGLVRSVAWSPNGRFVAVAHDTTPFITVYQRSGATFTKLSDPATLPTGNAYGVSWSPDGDVLAVAHDVTPFITLYSWNGSTLTKLADPAALPAGKANGCAWSPSGEVLAIAHDVSPYITMYRRSSTTFTKMDNPLALPAGNANGCAFSPNGQFLAVAHASSPFVTLYKTAGAIGQNAIAYLKGVAVGG